MGGREEGGRGVGVRRVRGRGMGGREEGGRGVGVRRVRAVT